MVNRKKVCKYSKIYDAKHIQAVGLHCPYKHKAYYWPARIQSNHFILGDSIIKFLKITNQADVVSYPGITIDRLCWKIKLNKFSVSKYKLIVLHVGTNDVEDLSIEVFINKYKTLLSAVQLSNNRAIVGCSSILPRPCSSKEVNDKIILANQEIKHLCKQSPTYFIPSYGPFVNKAKEINTDLYAIDQLHLGFKGSLALKKNLIGNITAIQGLYKKK